MIRLQNKITHLYARIKQLVSVLKESKIEIPKDNSIKKRSIKIGSKLKKKKESISRINCSKKCKKKPKLAPKIRPISLVAKPINIPILTPTKPTFILPNGHLIKIDTTPIISQPQILFDVPKILLLPDYKNAEILIAPKKNEATVTTSVNKRPIPSLMAYNRLLKETNFLNISKELTNNTKPNGPSEEENVSNKTKIIEKNINENKLKENDKHCSEPIKSNDNKGTTSHTIEAIVKDINQDKNDKSVEREEIVTRENICDASKVELKSTETENVNNNNKLTTDASECLTQTTSSVVNSLNILTDDNQRKSIETAKNIMSCFDDIRLPIPNSDFSTDLFSSLQGQVGGHHADSMSPTEAFLLSFPLVSTSKNTNILNENEQTEMNSSTPTTILQIGNLESPATELFQKNVDDCEKDPNKDKMKDQFSFSDKPYYNNDYIDTSKKDDQIYGYNKEVKKLKAIPPPQPTASTYHKTTYNDISSYYKTTQSNSDLWRYTSYNSFDKNLNKNTKKTDKSTSTVFSTNSVPYVPYELNTTNATTYIDAENYNDVWPHKPKQKKKQNEKSVPVNWMTDKGCQNSYAKRDDYNYQKKNNFDMSFDLQPEPKQTYSWSPSKTIPLLPHLDTNMPSTLPTLVGDLALNINTGSNTPFDQRIYECNKKSDIIPVTSSEQNMFTYKSRSVNSNFLSVSQLVEQPKTNDKRKGRNCAKDYCCVYQNQKTDKDYYQNQTKQYYPEINTFEQDQSWVRSKYSHDSSRSTNHSAESLIRHQQKNNSIVKSSLKNQHLTNKQTTCYRTGQKTSYNNNENFSNYYNQHNSNYLYDNRNDLDKQPSTYQISTNFYTPPTTTKHNISNYIPLPTTFSMTSSSYNKPAQHFTQNTNNYYNSSSNVNTLTNFNLSTIFPEMIDKVIYCSYYLLNNYIIK